MSQFVILKCHQIVPILIVQTSKKGEDRKIAFSNSFLSCFSFGIDFTRRPTFKKSKVRLQVNAIAITYVVCSIRLCLISYIIVTFVALTFLKLIFLCYQDGKIKYDFLWDYYWLDQNFH